MNNTPKISVIIPVYKTEQYLRRCLDSVCKQEYPNLEIICIDDGSPDNSRSILDEYAAGDSRFKVIHQENRGQGEARMSGLSIATGEWISMVDSDDYLEPGIYAKAAAVATDDVDIVCYEAQAVAVGDVNMTGIKRHMKLPVQGLAAVTPQLISELTVTPWGKLWRRSIIVSNAISMPAGHIHEDYVFFFCYIPFVRKGYFLAEMGYNYVLHSGSLTQSYKSGATEDLLSYSESWGYILKFYKDHHLLSSHRELAACAMGSWMPCCDRLPDIQDRKKCRAPFLALVVKYDLMTSGTGRMFFSPYFMNTQTLDEQTALWLQAVLKREVRVLKWRYKLSYGARRQALKQLRKSAMAILANLEST